MSELFWNPWGFLAAQAMLTLLAWMAERRAKAWWDLARRCEENCIGWNDVVSEAARAALRKEETP